MQETVSCGILSYAGLSKDTLFSLAKQAFAQADFDVPERFSRFLPLFPLELIQNMDYIGKAQTGRPISPSGFSIDPAEYHHKLYTQMPSLYENDNYRRNFDYEGKYLGRGVVTVDKAWAAQFPQYQPFMGEKLMIYLLGGGHQAVAVPESVYPRGMGILRSIERRMQVTQRAEQFVCYVQGRVEAGEAYDAESFQQAYLQSSELEPVSITQKEIGRVLQDVSIAKSLQNENTSAGVFTESAKRVEHLRQYVPFGYACDTFEPTAVTRHTARLCQPCFQGADYISDMWMPYQDVNSYIDKEHMTLDMARLCDGYQIAPVYDPQTRGGLYPDSLRVVIVRDREIPMMIGDVLNNPAYGGGMSPQGMIGRQVFIPDSRELLRQRKLMPEEFEIKIVGTALPPEEYRRALALAALQESKGKLVDTMYRREAALSQMIEGTRPYMKAKELLDAKVKALQGRIANQSAAWKHGQVSGYDADIDYLRRKQLDREGAPEDEQHRPIAFAVDAKREQSIESGYAMRSGLVHMSYTEAYLPPEAHAPDEFVYVEEAEDESRAALARPEPVADAADRKSVEAEAQAEVQAEVQATAEESAAEGNEGAKPTQGTEDIKAAAEGEKGDVFTGEDERVDEVIAEGEAGDETTAEDRANDESVADAKDSDERGSEGDESADPSAGTVRRSATFDAIAPRARSNSAPAPRDLKNIARREKKLPALPTSKRGKMASLVQKKGKKK